MILFDSEYNMSTLIKTQIAVEIYKIFKSKNITQAEFSKLLGIRQAKISRILNGHLNEFSLESLINYLQLLNKYVEITVSDYPNSKEL